MTALDPAYCADGCGRLAETERPTADGRREQVCGECAHPCGCILGPIDTRTDHQALADRGLAWREHSNQATEETK